jgi:predicted transcriptional regulator
MLAREDSQRILIVTASGDKIIGIVTGGDILRALRPREAHTNT